MDDLISRQAAIKATWQDTGYTDPFNVMTAIRDRIQQLPPIQPEQTNCDYCHEDVDGYVKPIEKNGHAFVRFGMDGWELSLKANGWHGSAKIRYCPMCGRRLIDG